MYKMSLTTLDTYLKPHREEIKERGAKRKDKKGKIIYSQNFNSKQLEYLVNKIMGDSPEGYEFDGKTFIKVRIYKI